jgi:hypothetical protein
LGGVASLSGRDGGFRLFVGEQFQEHLPLGVVLDECELPSEDFQVFVVYELFHDLHHSSGVCSGWLLQVVASEPENRVRFQRVGFDRRNMDVTAAATFERSDIKPGWSGRQPCQQHASAAPGTVRPLDRDK